MICGLGPLAQPSSLDYWEQLEPDRDPRVCDDRFRGIHEAWAAQRDDAEIYYWVWHMLRRCYLFSRQFTAGVTAGPLAFLA